MITCHRHGHVTLAASDTGLVRLVRTWELDARARNAPLNWSHVNRCAPLVLFTDTGLAALRTIGTDALTTNPDPDNPYLIDLEQRGGVDIDTVTAVLNDSAQAHTRIFRVDWDNRLLYTCDGDDNTLPLNVPVRLTLSSDTHQLQHARTLLNNQPQITHISEHRGRIIPGGHIPERVSVWVQLTTDQHAQIAQQLADNHNANARTGRPYAHLTLAAAADITRGATGGASITGDLFGLRAALRTPQPAY
jgi:hypothetical protein